LSTQPFKLRAFRKSISLAGAHPRVLDAAFSSSDEVLLALDTTEAGLQSGKVGTRLIEYGPNEVLTGRSAPAWSRLLFQFRNPFIVLVTSLGIIALFLGDLGATALIFSMVGLSVLLQLVQETRSTRTLNRLQLLVQSKATVQRINENGESQRVEVSLRDIVPGDIIHLAAGDMIPADIRLLSTRDLFVSQSALTGEALPVEKFDTLGSYFDRRMRPNNRDSLNPLDLPDLGFMGTNVVSGTAIAVALATGYTTYFASLVKRASTRESVTGLDLGISRVSWLFIRFMLFIVPVVLFLNGFTKGDWGLSFLFALSVAVGLTPEMLPVIVTTSLMRGALSMARNRIIVKRLNAIKDLGTMDVLCTDKTGTLTIDRIILEHHLDVFGKSDETVLRYAYLNSFFQTGLRNLLDAAILEHVELHETLHVTQDYRKVDELPFDFTRRRMSVILEKHRRQHEIICKGALDEVLEVCSHAYVEGKVVPLSEEFRCTINHVCDELNDSGLRLVAVAVKDIAAENVNYQYRLTDESGLTLVGYVAFLDPPKESIVETVATLQRQGIHLKILTGDNELVARRTCRWVDLPIKNVFSGSEIEAMSDAELSKAADQANLFVKLTPFQKTRVISSLKSQGHTVGFLGDGINDVPALCEANIGISVDTAADVAKESADLVMLEKSLLVLSDVVQEARQNSANILKYVKMAASSNFGNVLTVLISSVFFPFLPMQPIQLLMQNLLYDLSQTAIALDSVDAEVIARPQRWNPVDIGRFMLILGPISSVFDFVTFFVLHRLTVFQDSDHAAFFQTGWFVEGLLSQTLIVFVIRTHKIPFWSNRPSWPLLAGTVLVMLVGAVLPATPIGISIGFVHLPKIYFAWLTGILITYCLFVQALKPWFIRRFDSWI